MTFIERKLSHMVEEIAELATTLFERKLISKKYKNAIHTCADQLSELSSVKLHKKTRKTDKDDTAVRGQSVKRPVRKRQRLSTEY